MIENRSTAVKVERFFLFLIVVPSQELRYYYYRI